MTSAGSVECFTLWEAGGCVLWHLAAREAAQYPVVPGWPHHPLGLRWRRPACCPTSCFLGCWRWGCSLVAAGGGDDLCSPIPPGLWDMWPRLWFCVVPEWPRVGWGNLPLAPTWWHLSDECQPQRQDSEPPICSEPPAALLILPGLSWPLTIQSDPLKGSLALSIIAGDLPAASMHRSNC